MSMRHCLTSALALAAAGLCVAGPASASNLQRLSAEFQNNATVGGSGGTGDCHDNTIYFSGCTRVLDEEHKGPQTADVVIKLADLVGGVAFYERSTIYIDGQHDPRGELCKGVGTGPH